MTSSQLASDFIAGGEEILVKPVDIWTVMLLAEILDAKGKVFRHTLPEKHLKP